MTRSLALVTYDKLPLLSPDDQLVRAALERRGVRAEPVVWDDPSVEWARFDAIVVRSCWDYHLRYEQFMRWIDARAAEDVVLWNPPSLLHWNSDKRYLRELEERGVAVVPTCWVERGSHATLAEICAIMGWTDLVVKPAVSASAHSTWRALPSRQADAERFTREIGQGTVLVQPLVEQVARDGELSLVFLGESFSHAVVKRPKPGDFRVQHEHGGSADLVRVSDEVIEEAARALSAAPASTIYARVDGCLVDGGFVLMELELLEPSLFFSLAPAAAERFAELLSNAIATT